MKVFVVTDYEGVWFVASTYQIAEEYLKQIHGTSYNVHDCDYEIEEWTLDHLAHSNTKIEIK